MPGILLTHAKIYTLDRRSLTASAIAVDCGRVLAIGPTERLLAEFGSRFHHERLDGRTILPGLTDSHLHLQLYAEELDMVNCELDSKESCLGAVAERARQTPPGEWLRGTNWNQNLWKEGRAEAADLDRAAPANPVYILHKSHHSAWVNHAALELAGLNSTTPDPPGGRLGRLPDGSLDGVLYEGSATQLVEKIIPKPDVSQVAALIQKALPNLHRVGLTGVHDMDRRDCFAALQLLRASGRLNLRVLKSIPLEDLPAAAGLGLRSGFGDDMLRIGPVKAFMDGALGPQTAAMFDPYEGSADERGILMMQAEELFEHARLAAENGLSMAVHAIGDRAIHETLNAYQMARLFERTRFGATRLRHRIEHLQLIHPKDLNRLKELEVIASMQPIHATSDMLMADKFWGERSARAYAPRFQLDLGVRVIFGSDAPVESPNPFLGLHAAVTRRRADGSPGERGWRPEQRLSLSEALPGFTTAPAYAAGLDDRLGKLAPGFLADLIVLEEDPFDLEPHEIRNILPVRTMLDGKWVYQSDGD